MNMLFIISFCFQVFKFSCCESLMNVSFLCENAGQSRATQPNSDKISGARSPSWERLAVQTGAFLLYVQQPGPLRDRQDAHGSLPTTAEL